MRKKGEIMQVASREKINSFRQLVSRNPHKKTVDSNFIILRNNPGNLTVLYKTCNLICNEIFLKTQQLYRINDLINCLEATKEEYPFVAEVENRLGQALFIAGRFKEAEIEFEMALTLVNSNNHHSLHSIILSNMGFTLVNLGKLAEAKIFLKKALIANPENCEAKIKLLEISPENYGELRVIIKSDPNNVSAISALGRHLLKYDDPDAAYRSFKKCIELEPENPKHWIEAAGALREINKNRKASYYYFRTLIMPINNRDRFYYAFAAIDSLVAALKKKN